MEKTKSVNFRKMTECDRDAYFEMSRDFYVCGAAHEPISEESRRSFWKEILSGKLISGYIIEYGSDTAGYALVAYYASQEYGGKIALFDELYISPQYRGLGIGKKAFEFVEAGDVVACRLEAEPKNERAIKLYKSIGYKEFDYVQMSKKIK